MVWHNIGSGRCEIAKVEVRECVQRQQDPGWRFARGNITHVHGWIVSLESRGGLRGDGHILTTPLAAPDAERARRAIDEVMPLLQGTDAFNLERLHLQIAEAAPKDPCVLAGFTAALHELVSRALAVPLWMLLGGRLRKTVPVARLIPIKPPEAMAEEARRLVAGGYRILKLKFDGNGDDDLARVRAVRVAVDPSVQLCVDANQAYDADAAVEVCRALKSHRVLLMEQPVAAADYEGLKRVSDCGGVPVEADESIGGSLSTLAELIAMRAARSYNLKVHYFGGLRNTRIAMRLCEAAQVPYRFGAIFAPRLASAQAAHLAASAHAVAGGAEIGEFDHLLDDPYRGFDVQDGQVPVLDGVGSGIALPARQQSP